MFEPCLDPTAEDFGFSFGCKGPKNLIVSSRVQGFEV